VRLQGPTLRSLPARHRSRDTSDGIAPSPTPCRHSPRSFPAGFCASADGESPCRDAPGGKAYRSQPERSARSTSGWSDAYCCKTIIWARSQAEYSSRRTQTGEVGLAYKATGPALTFLLDRNLEFSRARAEQHFAVIKEAMLPRQCDAENIDTGCEDNTGKPTVPRLDYHQAYVSSVPDTAACNALDRSLWACFPIYPQRVSDPSWNIGMTRAAIHEP